MTNILDTHTSDLNANLSESEMLFVGEQVRDGVSVNNVAYWQFPDFQAADSSYKIINSCRLSLYTKVSPQCTSGEISVTLRGIQDAKLNIEGLTKNTNLLYGTSPVVTANLGSNKTGFFWWTINLDVAC